MTLIFFFFNDTATTEIYTLSLHDALPICNFHIKLQYEDASKLFLQRLKGVTDPERKRKIIGRTFIEVFQAATKRAGKAKFLAQGTLYPDVIESVPIAGNPAAMIKSHHNVGGLPKNMKFKLVDRKSTRLNSSHGYISYAVFCLKKKKINLVRIYRITHACQ